MSTGRLDEAESIETCIEALDETATVLSHHPPRALAAALVAHLQGILAVLYAQDELSAHEIKQLLEEIARGVCGEDP